MTDLLASPWGSLNLHLLSNVFSKCVDTLRKNQDTNEKQSVTWLVHFKVENTQQMNRNEGRGTLEKIYSLNMDFPAELI